MIWEFGGDDISERLHHATRSLIDAIPLQIAALLSDEEVVAMQERAQWVCEQQRFPINHSGHFYPWPLV